MQSLTDGLYTEDFFYGYPYDQVLPFLPTQFDYEGTAITNAGTQVCPRGAFTLEYGRDTLLNDDATLPYGGAPDSNDYYLRFPALSWAGTAAFFVQVECTDEAELLFDRAWSGYVGDTFSVVVNGMELLSITGSAGYGWTRSSVLLPAGANDIAFVLATAPAASGALRGGIAQSGVVQDLFRYLRLTNLSISNVADYPVADNQKLTLIAESSLTDAGNVTVAATSGQLTFQAVTSLLWPKKLADPLALTAEATLNGERGFVAKNGVLALTVQSSLSVVAAVEYDLPPAPGGLGLDSSAQLAVESTLIPSVADYARPLMYSRLTMTQPVIIAGRPASPLALSETELEISVEPIVLDKINPVSPKNVLPVTPTLRWLSLAAHYDPASEGLMEWFDTTGAGAVWTNPGEPTVYSPSVAPYSIRSHTGVTTVDYPAVHFDSGHGDHVLATLPAPVIGASTGLTFVIVGTFHRYRGALEDSCPILDYGSKTPIDYSTQRTPQRGAFPWADNDGAASIYLGLVPANRQEPTVSKIAWMGPTGYRTTDDVVISDDTPMVVVYSVSGKGSFVTATPLVTGQSSSAGRMTANIPTGPVDETLTRFALGKARTRPPVNGTFATGSMSLLDVSYYTRALSKDEAFEVSAFLVGLYAPVAQPGSKQLSFTGHGGLNTEAVLLYANDPELPLALISGSKTTVTDLWVSDPTSADYIDALTKAGVPLVRVSNRDYTAILEAGENTR